MAKHKASKDSSNAPAQQFKVKSPLDPLVSDYVRHIESGRLYPVGVRRSTRAYIKETWDRRAFIWKDSRSKVRTQNQQHRLGSWWLVIKPVFDVIFFWILFGLVLKASRGMENYTAYIIIGVLMFQYFARALTQNASVMLQGKAMMRAFSFPRITVPLSLAVREALSMGPVLLVMFLGIIIIPPHAFLTFSWLLFIPAFALNVLFNLGLGLIIARFAYVVPDIGQILGVVSRILLYGSAVIFPIEQFINHPGVTAVIRANPVYIFIDLYRTLLISGGAGDAYHWLSLLAWSIGLLVIGFIIFWRAEEVYGREFN